MDPDPPFDPVAVVDRPAQAGIEAVENEPVQVQKIERVDAVCRQLSTSLTWKWPPAAAIRLTGIVRSTSPQTLHGAAATSRSALKPNNHGPAMPKACSELNDRRWSISCLAGLRCSS